LQILTISGLICDKATLISSFILVSLSRFLVFILVNVEKPSLHKYEVENCNKIFSVFMERAGYPAWTEIQDSSRVISLNFIFRVRSIDKVINCSSSCNENSQLDVLTVPNVSVDFVFNHNFLYLRKENNLQFFLLRLI